MSRNRWRFSKPIIAIGVFGLAVGLLAGLTVLITGQQGTGRGMGLVDDWTHHHLVFSNPGTAPDALAEGRFEQWYRIVNDPRYNMQQMKRNPMQRALATAPDFATLAARLSAPFGGRGPIGPPPWRNPKQTLKRDWSMNLGGAGATQTGSFSGTTTPTTSQTVTITNTSPSNTLTLTMSGTTGTLSFSSQPTANNTVTIGSTVYQFETAAGSCSSSDRCVAIGGTTTITATNLKSAIGGTCFNSGGCPGGNTNDPDVLAETTGTTVVTVIDMTTGSITFTKSGTYPTLSPSGGTLTQAVTNTCSSTSAGQFIINSSTSTLASNLAAAITACNSSYSAVGVSAVQDGTNTSQVDLTADIAGTAGITLAESVGNFTWTGTTLTGGLPAATVGAGIYPAKYSFDITTYNCATDFVAYNTGLAGGSSQATIIAYNELYAGLSPGCGTTGVPAIYWQYNTAYPYVSGGGGSADGSSIVTSVVLSGTGGSQVAFIESNSSSVASLVILTWAPSSSLVQMNSSTNNVAPGSYRGCTAPCMTRITFSGSHNDTKSSPFYDYANDVIYVGDDNGSLHKFTGVFNGTPAEAGTPWPVSVSSGNKLTGPVYDTSTGLVFVGDTGTAGTPFHSVCAVTGINAVCTTAGTVTTSGTISGSNRGMDDAPIVDSTLSKAYVFIGYDNSTSCTTSGSGSTYCGSVFQYATKTSIASGSQTPVKAIMGRGGLNPLYVGAFNDGYYSAGTGALYVCGGSASGQSNAQPTLYKITITSGAMGSSTTGPTITSAVGPFCSPVTEVLNGSTDYLFLSVTSLGNDTGCTGACIYSYTIPGTFSSSLVANAGLAAAGGTSGIVIDNTTNTTGASQVYFSTLSAQGQGCAGNGTTGSGAGGCAVQASQSALH